METMSVNLLQDQISPGNIIEGCRSNLIAIMNYENSVLAVTRNSSELLSAYPFEDDPGIYVVAINGRVVAANNVKGVSRYLESLSFEGLEIMVHKLGAMLDLNLHNKLREYSFA